MDSETAIIRSRTATKLCIPEAYELLPGDWLAVLVNRPSFAPYKSGLCHEDVASVPVAVGWLDLQLNASILYFHCDIEFLD